MGKLGIILELASFLRKPLKKLRKGRRRVKRTARKAAFGAGLGYGVGKAVSGRKGKEEDADFNKKYSNFMNYVKSSDIPNKYYGDFNSIYKDSSNPDYIERIKDSLDIVERMHEDKAINKREYTNLKDRLYSNFKEEIKEDPVKKNIEDYLPLAASILFLLSGALFFNVQATGFSVLADVAKYKLDFFGVISFVLSLSLLLVFLKRVEKK